MESMLSSWSAIGPRSKIFTALAAAMAIATLFLIGRMASEPSMELLYGGLNDMQAGEIIAALDVRSEAYELRGNSIFVGAGKRDKLRLGLAANGLPSYGVSGYELLDKLSGFGTTSEMFDAAYWRAKEGELARTVMASPFVRSARVHISPPSDDRFGENKSTTASISITPVGLNAPENYFRAFQYLIASAVTGLKPEDVTVIDATSGIIMGKDQQASNSVNASSLAGDMKVRIERMLGALVGNNNIRVEVDVTAEMHSEKITQRILDPSSKVAISSDSQESSHSEAGQVGTGVTVASNLPNGAAGAGATQSNAQQSETRERINFDISETRRETQRGPGEIKRITVAVLLNSERRIESDGQVSIRNRSSEELSDVRDLVAASVGFDEKRGDVVTVKEAVFEIPESQDFVEANWFLSFLRENLISLSKLAVFLLAVVFVSIFVLRPAMTGSLILSGRSNKNGESRIALIEEEAQQELDAGNLDFGGQQLPQVLPDFGDISEKMAMVDNFKLDEDYGMSADVPIDRLRSILDSRRQDALEILRDWLKDTADLTG